MHPPYSTILLQCYYTLQTRRYQYLPQQRTSTHLTPSINFPEDFHCTALDTRYTFCTILQWVLCVAVRCNDVDPNIRHGVQVVGRLLPPTPPSPSYCVYVHLHIHLQIRMCAHVSSPAQSELYIAYCTHARGRRQTPPSHCTTFTLLLRIHLHMHLQIQMCFFKCTIYIAHCTCTHVHMLLCWLHPLNARTLLLHCNPWLARPYASTCVSTCTCTCVFTCTHKRVPSPAHALG